MPRVFHLGKGSFNGKSRPSSRSAIVLVMISLLPLLHTACNPGFRNATTEMIDEAEQEWKQSSIADYRIVVDIQLDQDQRRNEITVRNGQVTQALTQYWNEEQGHWDNASRLNEQQALAFTVPGLLETVREEIEAETRGSIQIRMKKDTGVPDAIILQPKAKNPGEVAGVKTFIFVREFEPLPSESQHSGP